MLKCDQNGNSNERFFFSSSIGQRATAIGLTIGQRCSSVTKLETVMRVAVIPMHTPKSWKKVQQKQKWRFSYILYQFWEQSYSKKSLYLATKNQVGEANYKWEHCPGILWVPSKVRPTLVLWLGLHPHGLHPGERTWLPGSSGVWVVPGLAWVPTLWYLDASSLQY